MSVYEKLKINEAFTISERDDAILRAILGLKLNADVPPDEQQAIPEPVVQSYLILKKCLDRIGAASPMSMQMLATSVAMAVSLEPQVHIPDTEGEAASAAFLEQHDLEYGDLIKARWRNEWVPGRFQRVFGAEKLEVEIGGEVRRIPVSDCAAVEDGEFPELVKNPAQQPQGV